MIDIVYNDFFDKKGIVLDDAYDPYKLKLFQKYYLENKIEYIRSKDIALENLHCFNDLKYVSIPGEALNYSELSSLVDLRGIEVCYPQLQFIPIKILEAMESLILHIGNDIVDLKLKLVNLKNLKLDGFPGFYNTDLCFINGVNLKCLSIASKKLKTLSGIENQQNLEKLSINSCTNLYDISDIYSLRNLKTLCLSECNKLQKDFVDYLPSSLESLSIFGSERMGPKCRFSTFDFLRKMDNLQVLKTNWKISAEQFDLISKTVPKFEVYS